MQWYNHISEVHAVLCYHIGNRITEIGNAIGREEKEEKDVSIRVCGQGKKSTMTKESDKVVEEEKEDHNDVLAIVDDSDDEDNEGTLEKEKCTVVKCI